MAAQTLKLASVRSDAGDIVLTLQYDDVAMLATAVMCDNPSQDNVGFSISRDSDGKTITRTFGPGMGQILTIPTNQANRISLVINSRGRLNGYTVGVAYPA